MSDWSVVVPTVRPDTFVEFLEAWKPLFEKHDVQLIVVNDAPSLDPKIEDAVAGLKLTDIVLMDHGSLHPFIPTHTDMIRSAGIFRAWEAGSEYTLTLDDDVRPFFFEGDVESFYVDAFEEYEKVFDAGAPVSNYLSVGSLTTSGLEMRGFPFGDRSPREVAVQYGGWDGVLDYDAPTQLLGAKMYGKFERIVMPVPRGCVTTCCIMNAAWRTSYAPIMWQLPLLEGRYNRFGDIWSGLFIKHTLDHLGKAMVINGEASVSHCRASDPLKNLERELPGIPVNEALNKSLLHDPIVTPPTDMVRAYTWVTNRAAGHFRRFDPEYADHFIKARDAWLALF